MSKYQPTPEQIEEYAEEFDNSGMNMQYNGELLWIGYLAAKTADAEQWQALKNILHDTQKRVVELEASLNAGNGNRLKLPRMERIY